MNLRNPFSRPADDPGSLLADLILAAREDVVFRNQILALVSLPLAQREPLIHTALHEMRLRGESAAACAAFGALGTEDGATAAARLLRE